MLPGSEGLPLGLHIRVMFKLGTGLGVFDSIGDGFLDTLVHDNRVHTPTEVLGLNGNQVHVQHVMVVQRFLNP